MPTLRSDNLFHAKCIRQAIYVAFLIDYFFMHSGCFMHYSNSYFGRRNCFDLFSGLLGGKVVGTDAVFSLCVVLVVTIHFTSYFYLFQPVAILGLRFLYTLKLYRL